MPQTTVLSTGFAGMHSRIEALYNCDCPQCVALKSSDSLNVEINFDHKTFDRAMSAIYAAGKVNPDSLNLPGVKSLINETYGALSEAVSAGIGKTEMPPAMAQKLDAGTFLFSGMKVYNEIKEGSLKLRDENGAIKPFDKFRQEVAEIDEKYNMNYLRAEYNFAQRSARMAARWQEFQADGDDFNLQYRTAGDGRVREEHARMDGITLPVSDSFWSKYFPPNGWNCRCNVVQVRKSKYPESDHGEAIRQGELATTQNDAKGANRAQIFRFNPGKSGNIFPPDNPYCTSKCSSCDSNKIKLAADIPVAEKCQACRILNTMHENARNRRLVAAEKAEIRTQVNNFVNNHLPEVEIAGTKTRRITIINLETNDQVIINRQFFNETFTKNIRNNRLVETMQLAMRVNKWLPKALYTGTEAGRHHDYPFKVFTVNYKGVDIECKAKVTDAIYLYTMKIL